MMAALMPLDAASAAGADGAWVGAVITMAMAASDGEDETSADGAVEALAAGKEANRLGDTSGLTDALGLADGSAD
jgi:hypothetical protein